LIIVKISIYFLQKIFIFPLIRDETGPTLHFKFNLLFIFINYKYNQKIYDKKILEVFKYYYIFFMTYSNW